jgi:hypothetical protein
MFNSCPILRVFWIIRRWRPDPVNQEWFLHANPRKSAAPFQNGLTLVFIGRTMLYIDKHNPLVQSIWSEQVRGGQRNAMLLAFMARVISFYLKVLYGNRYS